jgi:hypothetical protein
VSLESRALEDPRVRFEDVDLLSQEEITFMLCSLGGSAWIR